jgi:hypothetical protein
LTGIARKAAVNKEVFYKKNMIKIKNKKENINKSNCFFKQLFFDYAKKNKKIELILKQGIDVEDEMIAFFKRCRVKVATKLKQ